MRGYNFNVVNSLSRASWCLSSKNASTNAGDAGSIPGLGRSPGGGNGNPLWDSYLENPMHRGAWRATVHRVAKSRTRLSDQAYVHTQSDISVAPGTVVR